MLRQLLVGIVDACRRHPVTVLLVGVLLVAVSGWVVATRLRISTDTALLFADSLPWQQHARAMQRDFPQFQGLLVAVVDGRTPEQVEATAAAVARAATDSVHFIAVRRPDALPFFAQHGLLFLDQARLAEVLDRTIDAQPFLGQLAADPSARGLFATLGLLGTGVARGEAAAVPGALNALHLALNDALAGRPRPLSWQGLLGTDLDGLAGGSRLVLLQPRLDHGMLEPGSVATRALRTAITGMEFVRSGDARVRLTGQVALADEEFSTIAEGAAAGMLANAVIIALLLYLAVRSWRLIVPILATLGIGLALTFLFAAVAVGRLNVVSVGFGVLFIGLADDFADQFTVRFREHYLATGAVGEAMRRTAATAGGQILFAALTIAAGFLAFVPTDFHGVSELGLIAGVGMLIAFACNVTFLPAAIAVFRPPGETSRVGFAWAAPIDRAVQRWRWPIMLVFAALGATAALLAPRLGFDSDPLNTKNPHTEAMQTLRDLIRNPVTNPYTIDIMAGSVTDAVALAERLQALPSVAEALTIADFVPRDQAEKLALIADARTLLAATLAPRPPPAPPTAEESRAAAAAAATRIAPALAKLPADSPLAGIADDLRRLAEAPDDIVLATDAALTRFLPEALARLRLALSATPVTLADLPAELRRDWLLPDGRARVQVAARAEALARIGLEGFAAEVRGVAPHAGGSVVASTAASATIMAAFRAGVVNAFALITLILAVALRRPLDVVLVLSPLVLSGLLTLLVSILLGQKLNFANIVALPLLLGVGVSFNVYTVMNWRAGLGNPLASATTRAIVYSALTTATAFGALALSAHPGTASFGMVLLLGLACSLLVNLLFLPALLNVVGQSHGGA